LYLYLTLYSRFVFKCVVSVFNTLQPLCVQVCCIYI